MSKKIKVVVAISGGIDSAVAAYLLKKKGYDVTAIFLQLTDSKPNFPPLSIAKFLDIPYVKFDLRNVFKQAVIDYFINAYLRGMTPNPCIICNQKIKFGLLLEKAKRMGFDYIATGHYARKCWDEKSRRYLLLRSIDKEKEQSYFLFALNQEQLSHIIWPLGDLSKTKVKEIALSIDFPNIDVKESQELCFIPKGDYRYFLKQYIKSDYEIGEIVDTKGEHLGWHKGLWYYTVGQRHGIGIPEATPYYVRALDVKQNRLVVAKREELYSSEMIVKDVNFIAFQKLQKPVQAIVKVRYQHPGAWATLLPLTDNKIKVMFAEPQFGITPGQAAVFYKEDICLGGGWISQQINKLINEETNKDS